jgi:hypothetical protein
MELLGCPPNDFSPLPVEDLDPHEHTVDDQVHALSLSIGSEGIPKIVGRE